MNIAEDRTVVVETVKRPSSFLQVLGGTGVFRERRLHVVCRGLGQPARLTAGGLATRPVLGARAAGSSPDAVTSLQSPAL